MKINSNLFLLFLPCFFSVNTFAEQITKGDIIIESDSISENKSKSLEIFNAQVLNPFFDQLRNLETTNKGKIRIVQIGDSHIQADFLSNVIKDVLQNKFGNGGFGFAFPHKLANTNGSNQLRFKSNTNFSSNRNVRPSNDRPIGISGYTISTQQDNAVIEVEIKNAQDFANNVKIITPNNEKFFDLAFTENKSVEISKTVQTPITHKVKKGETLSSIAKKYKLSVVNLKKMNGLKSDKLAVGKSLKVGNNQQIQSKVAVSDFDKVALKALGDSYFYENENAFEKFYLISDNQFSEVELSGLILENNSTGITFSGIGANGAKYSDYNRFPMFFEQLKALQPNLIIVSLGTNESFDRLDVSEYIQNVQTFVEKVKETNPNTVVLVTTPPPSTLHRKYENTFIADYTQAIIETSNSTKAFAVFDLYQNFGGKNGVQLNKQKGYLAKDEVHYTKDGYEAQGNLLAKALLQAYQNYISNK